MTPSVVKPSPVVETVFPVKMSKAANEPTRIEKIVTKIAGKRSFVGTTRFSGVSRSNKFSVAHFVSGVFKS